MDNKERYKQFRSYFPTRLLIGERKRYGGLIANGEIDKELAQQRFDELNEVISMLKEKFGVIEK